MENDNPTSNAFPMTFIDQPSGRHAL